MYDLDKKKEDLPLVSNKKLVHRENRVEQKIGKRWTIIHFPFLQESDRVSVGRRRRKQENRTRNRMQNKRDKKVKHVPMILELI